MKKILVLILIIILLSGNINFSENIYLSGNNYILMEEESGRILVEKNAYEKMPMASTTKIMTALVAIELGNLDDYVEITEESVGIIGSSIYLELGEKIKLEDLLYGLMLRSGNDSSVAIAVQISGSIDDFVKEMNKKAVDIGANYTNFSNPHGLHDDNHYSTPYDMALITREAILNEKFSTIWKSKSHTSNRHKNNYFVNKNKTLWQYQGGDGGKTGYTSDSGRCLVSTAKRNNMRLIAVSFNARDWFNDNYKLLNHGFENYNLYSIYSRDQLLKKLKLENGSKDNLLLVSEESFLYPLGKDELDSVKLSIDVTKEPFIPISAGEQLGHVKTYLNEKIIRNDKLVVKYEVTKKPFYQRIKDIF